MRIRRKAIALLSSRCGMPSRRAPGYATASNRQPSAGVAGELCIARRLRRKSEITPVDECIAGIERNAVAQLPRRTFHIVGRRRHQGTSLAAFQRKLHAADRIDDDTRAVWRILDRQSHLQLDRRPTEAAALDADEADLVVALPRHVVG